VTMSASARQTRCLLRVVRTRWSDPKLSSSERIRSAGATRSGPNTHWSSVQIARAIALTVDQVSGYGHSSCPLTCAKAVTRCATGLMAALPNIAAHSVGYPAPPQRARRDGRGKTERPRQILAEATASRVSGVLILPRAGPDRLAWQQTGHELAKYISSATLPGSCSISAGCQHEIRPVPVLRGTPLRRGTVTGSVTFSAQPLEPPLLLPDRAAPSVPSHKSMEPMRCLPIR
jgi:hypothetical protein